MGVLIVIIMVITLPYAAGGVSLQFVHRDTDALDVRCLQEWLDVGQSLKLVNCIHKLAVESFDQNDATEQHFRELTAEDFKVPRTATDEPILTSLILALDF